MFESDGVFYSVLLFFSISSSKTIMSLLTELSANIIQGTTAGTFSQISVDDAEVANQVFTTPRAFTQDILLGGAVPNGNVISCVFAYPPGIPVVDSSVLANLLPLRDANGRGPWGVYFIDSAVISGVQYRLRVVSFDPTANSYFVGTQTVPDGYWAISGVDLTTLAGPPLTLTATGADAPWLQFAPGPSPPNPLPDSRRSYYLEGGIPKISGSAPLGSPYLQQGDYIENTMVKKIVTVYGSNGESAPGAVGYWTYDENDGTRLFVYVQFSELYNPLSGDFVPVQPRVYRIDAGSVTSVASLDGTYWGVEGANGIGSPVTSAYLVDEATDNLITVLPSSTASTGFTQMVTGTASIGGFYPSKYVIAFKAQDDQTAPYGWVVFAPLHSNSPFATIQMPPQPAVNPLLLQGP